MTTKHTLPKLRVQLHKVKCQYRHVVVFLREFSATSPRPRRRRQCLRDFEFCELRELVVCHKLNFDLFEAATKHWQRHNFWSLRSTDNVEGSVTETHRGREAPQIFHVLDSTLSCCLGPFALCLECRNAETERIRGFYLPWVLEAVLYCRHSIVFRSIKIESENSSSDPVSLEP